MQPWMGALEDNLEVLHLGTGKSSSNLNNPQGAEAPRNSTMELVRSKIKGQIPELHARSYLHEQVPDHRRGAEPDAQADEKHW
uniref:Uncharacterized protein n=1 Tax=Panagrolaimus superbus TaxID=310955 RepID=A0A914YL53_9BILA